MGQRASMEDATTMLGRLPDVPAQASKTTQASADAAGTVTAATANASTSSSSEGDSQTVQVRGPCSLNSRNAQLTPPPFCHFRLGLVCTMVTMAIAPPHT